MQKVETVFPDILFSEESPCVVNDSCKQSLAISSPKSHYKLFLCGRLHEAWLETNLEKDN